MENDSNSEEQEQEQYRQEDMMAGGPVSAGASNESAPMYGGSNHGTQGDENKQYNKLDRSDVSTPSQGGGMATTSSIGSPGGGTLPSSTNAQVGESSRGGVLSSDSTVSAGGSAAGRITGGGLNTDRGANTTTGMDMTTDTKGQLDERSDNISGSQGNTQES